MTKNKEFIGEMLGTFILVLFGCGSVAVSVLFGSHQGLMQIALAWGLGVTLAIYSTRHLSCAHLNPAVSIAMVVSGRMKARKLPLYIAAQFIGAFLAGWVIYGLFFPSIYDFEVAHNLIRGQSESILTGKIFGEYYPDPGSGAVVGFPLAMAVEGFGTFILVTIIFALTEGCNIGGPQEALAPLFVGLTVTSIICLLAPLTQAGLNPARDFGTRLVAWIMGWGEAAFPDKIGGFFFVYILSPIVGGILASLLFVHLLQPAFLRKTESCACRNDEHRK